MPCTFPFNNEHDDIISVIGEGDPFSVVSLGHLADTTSALSELCQDKGFRDEILKRATGHDHSDKLFCINAMNCLRTHMKAEKLYPPGIIYLMAGSLFNFNFEIRNGSQERECYEKIHRVEPSRFNELKLHARMFDLSYHIPARYEGVLERIVTTKT